MKFNPLNYDVADLLRLAREGHLGLPEFQRSFVWQPKDVADLLRTVARDWPAGSFLLLNGPQDFACKPLDTAPNLVKEPSLLILDGQQRMTALFQAFESQSDEIYYVDMRAMLAGEPFEDEHLKFGKKSRFARDYPDLKRMADGQVIPVPLLCDDTEFWKWTQYFKATEAEQAVTARKTQLSGFKSYQIPCVVLPSDTHLSALAKIFETINRTGVRLNVFDLMVAKLYPRAFRLRDKWDDALTSFPILGKYEADGIEILKLIALREHLRQHAAPGTPVTVKGVRESDVLALNVQVVIDRWEWAVESFAKALEFAREKCGMRAPNLLPAPAMLLPLADALGSDSLRNGATRDLERWFWVTAFSQSYGQGANTQAVSDARALRAWLIDASAIPAAIAEFKFEKSDLEDVRRRNEMLVAGLACLLTKRSARDWLKPAETLSGAAPLEYHHLYAKKYLKNLGIQEPDIVANLSIVTAATNQSLRNDAPETVAARVDVERSAVETHGIDWEKYKAGKWNDFLKNRVDQLDRLIQEVTR